jgi:hypothetical protein
VIGKAAADATLARARELAAQGVGLTDRIRREREALHRAIEAELVVLKSHENALAPAARGGDRDAAVKLVRLVELRGELHNALLALVSP